MTLFDSDVTSSICPHFHSFCHRFALTRARRLLVLLATFTTPPPVSRSGTPYSSPLAAATSALAAAATKRLPGRSVATQLPSKISRPFPYPAAPLEPSPSISGASTPWPSLLLHCLGRRKRFSLFPTMRRVTHSCAQCIFINSRQRSNIRYGLGRQAFYCCHKIYFILVSCCCSSSKEGR